jgi:hypothetical protein
MTFNLRSELGEIRRKVEDQARYYSLYGERLLYFYPSFCRGYRLRDLYSGFIVAAEQIGVTELHDETLATKFPEFDLKNFAVTHAGFYYHPEKKIWVHKKGHVNWRVKVLSHEVAHAYSFQYREKKAILPFERERYGYSWGTSTNTASSWPRPSYLDNLRRHQEAMAINNVLELSAELASYLLMRRLGYDSSAWSVPYLALNVLKAAGQRGYAFCNDLNTEVEYIYEQILDNLPPSCYTVLNGRKPRGDV